jgi:hypothetical protein
LGVNQAQGIEAQPGGSHGLLELGWLGLQAADLLRADGAVHFLQRAEPVELLVGVGNPNKRATRDQVVLNP